MEASNRVPRSTGAVAASRPLLYSASVGSPDRRAVQLLMAAQVPIVAFFAVKWLPRSPRQALVVLLLQAVAGLAALAPVFLLGL